MVAHVMGLLNGRDNKSSNFRLRTDYRGLGSRYNLMEKVEPEVGFEKGRRTVKY